MRQITISLFTRTGMMSLALLFILNSTAWAGKIFNWNNETGHTSFTDYRSSIPLKFRSQIKDEVEPPKFTAPPSTMKNQTVTETATQEASKEEGEKKESQGQQGEAQEEKGSEMTMDEELAKLMIQSVDFLSKEYNAFRKFLRAAKFDEEEGRYFILIIKNHLKKKEALAAQLEKIKNRHLQRVRNYLLDSLQYDRDAEIGKGPKYLRFLEDLESRIKTEQDTRQSLEKELRVELKEHGVTDEIAVELGGGRFGGEEKAEKGS